MSKRKKKQLRYSQSTEDEPRLSKLIKFLSRYKYFWALALFAFIPITWFRPWNTLITSGDFWLPVGPVDFWRSLLSSWLPNVSGGQTNNSIFELFPWVSFWALFKTLGMSLSDTEKIWFAILYLLGGISVYLLTIRVFRGEERGWQNIIPGVFYLFNVYIMMAGVTTTNLLVYMVTPLFLFVYIRGFYSQRVIEPAIALGLTTLLFASAAGNPPIYTIPFLTIGVFFLFVLISRSLTRRFFIMNVFFVFFYALFNLWWIFFYIQNILSQTGTLKELASSTAIGGGSYLFDVVRLLGSWAFFAGHMGYAYFPFAQSYRNPVLMFLTFLIPILAWAGFHLSQKKNFLVYFFALLGLLGIFLSHGRQTDWLGQLNGIVNSLVPFFWIYREPYAKFTGLTALSYALLLGCFISFLRTKIKTPLLFNLSALLLVFLVLTVAWPLVTGDHFPGKRGILAPSRKVIPDYWLKAANWLNSQKTDGRVFILPENPDTNRSGIPYQWGYDSADLVPFLLSVPWIERNNGYYVEALMKNVASVSRQVYKSFDEIDAPQRSLTPIFQLLNVSRLLQRNDVDLLRVGPLSPNYSPTRIKEVMSQQKDISLEKNFGNLDIYRLDPGKVAGKLYTASEIDCLFGDVDSLIYPADFMSEEVRTAIYSPVEGNTPIQKYCRKNFYTPVEVFNENSILSSLPFRSSFEASPTVLKENLSGISSELEEHNLERYFIFQVTQKGVYDVYLEKRRGGNYENPISLISLRNLNNPGVAISSKGQTPSAPPALTPGLNYQLEPGKYLIIYKDPKFVNLVKDDSLGESSWKSSLSQVPLTLSSDSYGVSKSLVLGAGAVDAFHELPQRLMEPRPYLVSLYYKVKSGGLPTFFIWENNCEKGEPIWTNFEKGNNPNCLSEFILLPEMTVSTDWVKYQAEYVPRTNPKRSGLGFVFLDKMQRARPTQGTILINNVVVAPKIPGGIVVKGQEGASQVEALGTPNLSLTAQSPTRYTVQVTGAKAPFFLVFSETFSKDWQVKFNNDTGLLVPAENHFIVNGYANAWYINKEGNYQIEISYRPQFLFTLLFAVSAIAVAGSLIYYFILGRKHHTYKL